MDYYTFVQSSYLDTLIWKYIILKFKQFVFAQIYYEWSIIPALIYGLYYSRTQFQNLPIRMGINFLILYLGITYRSYIGLLIIFELLYRSLLLYIPTLYQSIDLTEYIDLVSELVSTFTSWRLNKNLILINYKHIDKFIYYKNLIILHKGVIYLPNYTCIDSEYKEETDDCPICYESKNKWIVLKCHSRHKFCLDCSLNLIINYRNCPLCRGTISEV